MPQYETEIKALENLLWEFGLTDAIAKIQVTPNEDSESPALVCIVTKGSSSKVIATVFDEYDYFPKYEVIRKKFADTCTNIEVKFLI